MLKSFSTGVCVPVKQEPTSIPIPILRKFIPTFLCFCVLPKVYIHEMPSTYVRWLSVVKEPVSMYSMPPYLLKPFNLILVNFLCVL